MAECHSTIPFVQKEISQLYTVTHSSGSLGQDMRAATHKHPVKSHGVAHPPRIEGSIGFQKC